MNAISTAPLDTLAALKRQRDALSDELAGLRSQLAKVGAAVDSKASAQAALAQLDAEELAAMQAWLAGSGAEPAPKPDMEKRAASLQALGSAIQQETTVQAASAGVSDQIDAANRDIAALSEQIEGAAYDAIAAAYEAQHAGIVALGVEMQAKCAAVLGGLEFLRSEGQRYQAAGDITKATAVFSRLSRLGALTKPEFMPALGATREGAESWAARFKEMLK